MLTKKQLKDAARCCGGLCELCSCNKTRMAYQDCIREAAKTALAYREMLERHIIEEGHYTSLEELACNRYGKSH